MYLLHVTHKNSCHLTLKYSVIIYKSLKNVTTAIPNTAWGIKTPGFEHLLSVWVYEAIFFNKMGSNPTLIELRHLLRLTFTGLFKRKVKDCITV